MNDAVIADLEATLSPDGAVRSAAEARLCAGCGGAGAAARLSELVAVALGGPQGVAPALCLAAALAAKRLCASTDARAALPADTPERLAAVAAAAGSADPAVALHLALAAAELLRAAPDPATAPRACAAAAQRLAAALESSAWPAAAAAAAVLRRLVAAAVARRSPSFASALAAAAPALLAAALDAAQRALSALCACPPTLPAEPVARTAALATKTARLLATHVPSLALAPGTPGGALVRFVLDALTALRTLAVPQQMLEPVRTVQRCLAKTLLKLARRRGTAFSAPYAAACLACFDADLAAVGSPAGALQDDAYALYVLRFIKGVLEDSSTRAGSSDDDSFGRCAGQSCASGATSEASSPETLFPAGRVAGLVNALVQGCMVETRAQLEEELADPERALADEDVAAWKYLRRACAEALLLACAERFGAAALQPLLALLAQALAAPPARLAVALAKDAVYRAVGLCVFELAGQVPFAQVLAAMAQEEEQAVRAAEGAAAASAAEAEELGLVAVVLRRRLAWTLGTVFMLGAADTPVAATYEYLTRLLADRVLLLAFTAAAALHTVVDSTAFEPAAFRPFARAALGSLFALVVARVREVASRLRMLGVVIVLIEQGREAIVPDADALCDALCTLWNQTSSGYACGSNGAGNSDGNGNECSLMSGSEGNEDGDEEDNNDNEDDKTGMTMLRARVLDALTALLDAAGPAHAGEGLLARAAAVLEGARRARDAEVLLEAALELWDALFRNAARVTPALRHTVAAGDLARVLATVRDADCLATAASLLETVLVCGGAHDPALLGTLLPAVAAAVPELNRRGVECVLRPVATLFHALALAPAPPACAPPLDAIVAFCVRSAAAALALQTVAHVSASSAASARFDTALLAHLSVVARASLCDNGARTVAVCTAPATATTGGGIVSNSNNNQGQGEGEEEQGNLLVALYAAYTAQMGLTAAPRRAKLLLLGSLAAFPLARAHLPPVLVARYVAACRRCAARTSTASAPRAVQHADAVPAEQSVRLQQLVECDPVTTVDSVSAVTAVLGPET